MACHFHMQSFALMLPRDGVCTACNDLRLWLLRPVVNALTQLPLPSWGESPPPTRLAVHTCMTCLISRVCRGPSSWDHPSQAFPLDRTELALHCRWPWKGQARATACSSPRTQQGQCRRDRAGLSGQALALGSHHPQEGWCPEVGAFSSPLPRCSRVYFR